MPVRATVPVHPEMLCRLAFGRRLAISQGNFSYFSAKEAYYSFTRNLQTGRLASMWRTSQSRME
jgi:hypothetical protein